MAKIRAYRLAEELGIERAEFVEKAAAVGIVLKSAMASVEEGDADTLRSKLGGVRLRGATDEKRLETGGRTTVIRRRKKIVEPEPVPEPVAAAEEAVTEPAPVAAEPEPTPDPAPPAETVPTPESVVRPRPPTPAPPAEAKGAADSKGGAADRKGKQRKRVREVVNLREQEQFARQVTSRGGPRRMPSVADSRNMVSPRRRRRDAPAKPAVARAVPTDQPKVVRFAAEISVGEFAKQLGMKTAQVQGKLMALGKMVSVNQTIRADTAELLAAELGFEVQDIGFKEEVFLESEVSPEAAEGIDSSRLEPRAPVITVMGHVDHGKTSLLDAIRKTSVAEGEAGGITQHIGAYQAKPGNSTLTFIDTPGHAAFTAMRARGAQVTDIVVLVVAASDGVMPQTIEAIDHAKAAGCPIVVAINKIDLPGADPKIARQRLMEHGLVPEDFGGDTICVDVSAVKGTGIDQLLEMLALQAEVLELKADPSKRATAVVLEARLDKGRGPVATVLVRDGTLHRGDTVVCGTEWGRVRTLENYLGERIKEAGPSLPAQVGGLSGVVDASSQLHVVENEKIARQIVEHRLSLERSAPSRSRSRMTLEDIFAQGDADRARELVVVLKSDVHGTCEAVSEALKKLATDKVSLKILSSGVGGVTDSDIMLARASDAIVVGFNVRPDSVARRAADEQGVEIRSYQLIHELLDDVRAAMAGLLPPTVTEVVVGRAEVRQPFTIPRIGTIGGSYVLEGSIRRNSRARLIRDGVQIYDGRLGSLRRFKDDVREVQKDFECGIGIENYNDLKAGDIIEAYELEEKAATL